MRFHVEIKIEPVDGGWILSYPTFTKENQCIISRQVFMSLPKLKKKVAEVLTTIEDFQVSVLDQ